MTNSIANTNTTNEDALIDVGSAQASMKVVQSLYNQITGKKERKPFKATERPS